MPADRSGRTWWRDGVLYQIYPRSYMDTNADGVGDLRGIIAAARPPAVARCRGDLARSDHGVAERRLGLRRRRLRRRRSRARHARRCRRADRGGVEARHPRAPRPRSESHERPAPVVRRREVVAATRAHRDWYVWADPKPDGSFPNNWTMAFDPRQPAWTFDEASGQYYLNQFLPSQPDLNWWNEEVRDAFDAILRFWFDRGVAGFRIDVAHSVIKDRELRDNPPATPDDHWYVQMMGQRSVYNACRPEVHDVLRRWRKLAESYDPPRVLIGETYVLEPEAFASFYGDGDELNLAFNFMLLHSEFSRRRSCATRSSAPKQLLPAHAWPVWTGGNHDNHRFPTRWCKNDPAPHARRARHADGPARHAVPLLRRRDRHDRHRRAQGSHPRPGRRVPRRAHGSRRRTHADALVAGAGRGLLRRRASSRGSPTATTRAYNVADQRHDPGVDALADPRPHRSARRDARAARRRVPNAARAERRRVGLVARRAHRRRVQPLRRSRSTSPTSVPARSASPRSAPATTNGSRARCTSRRGKPRSSGATHDGHRAVDHGARRTARSRSTGRVRRGRLESHRDPRRAAGRATLDRRRRLLDPDRPDDVRAPRRRRST